MRNPEAIRIAALGSFLAENAEGIAEYIDAYTKAYLADEAPAVPAAAPAAVRMPKVGDRVALTFRYAHTAEPTVATGVVETALLTSTDGTVYVHACGTELIVSPSGRVSAAVDDARHPCLSVEVQYLDPELTNDTERRSITGAPKPTDGARA